MNRETENSSLGESPEIEAVDVRTTCPKCGGRLTVRGAFSVHCTFCEATFMPWELVLWPRQGGLNVVAIAIGFSPSAFLIAGLFASELVRGGRLQEVPTTAGIVVGLVVLLLWGGLRLGPIFRGRVLSLLLAILAATIIVLAANAVLVAVALAMLRSFVHPQ